MSISNRTSNVTTGCEGMNNPSRGPPPFRNNERTREQSYLAIVNKYNYSSILSECCKAPLGFYECGGSSNRQCCVYCNVTAQGLTASSVAFCAKQQMRPQEDEAWGFIEWDKKDDASQMRLGWWAWSVVGLAIFATIGGL